MKEYFRTLIGIFLILPFHVMSQNYSETTRIDVNIRLNTLEVKNPNVSSFQKVNHIPVSNYTGRANVTIPIFTVKSGDINVPISLSYNTSGVKVNDIASSVGLNWSLNAGGSITKTVKGIEDFNYDYRDNTGLSKMYSIGWLFRGDYIAVDYSLKNLLGNTAPYIVPDSYGGSYWNTYGNITINDDFRPDLFTASAPGLNTRFVHKQDKSIVELDYQGNQITSHFGNSPTINFFSFGDEWGGERSIKCINKIDITNTNGLQYEFGDIDIAQRAQVGPAVEYNRTQKYDLYSYSQVDTYHLSTIRSKTTNRTVTFNYEKYSQVQQEADRVEEYQITGRDLSSNVQPNVMREQFYLNKFPQLNRIKEIQFDQGLVEFIYAHERRDYVGELAIKFIIIKDFNGNPIKTFRFDYDYFVADTNCNEEKCLRLKLVGISIFGNDGGELPGYEFTYNETPLPERNTFNQDYLGYANSPSSDLIGGAPILYYAINNGKTSLFPVPLGNRYTALPGTYSMQSNLTYTQAGILKKIQYPTGGFTEFEYELNSFLLNGMEVNGAGLRLSMQKKTAPDSTEETIYYKYEKEDGTTSGLLNSLPIFGQIKLGPYGDFNGDLDKVTFTLFRTSRSQSELTDGAFVGYSRVIEQKQGNGHQEFLYTNSDEFSDRTATVYACAILGPCGNEPIDPVKHYQVDFFDKNGGFSDFVTDKGLFRGKLKIIKTFDNEGTLLHEKEINYLANEFDRINLKYFREERNIADFGSGPYRDQNYRQEIDLISQRHLPSYEKNTSYYKNDRTVVTETNYIYHTDLPLPIEYAKKIGNNLTDITKVYYPADAINLPNLSAEMTDAIQEMLIQNKVSTPIQIENYINTSKTLTERNNYVIAQSNKVLPSTIMFSKRNNELQDRIEYTNYDDNGNPLCMRQKDGSYISYIYGYNNNKVIAILKNQNIVDIPIATINNLKDLSNMDVDLITESNLKLALDNLRTQFPNAQVTSYTYDPLIGVTSITDLKGYTMTYHYDEFNRLKFVKDKDGNLVSENKYNYKN